MTPFAFFASLRVRLFLAVVLALAPGLAVILRTAAEWRQHENRDMEIASLRMARQASIIHDRLIDESRDLLVALAQLPSVSELDQSGLRDILLAFLREHPNYSNLGIVDPEGTILSSAKRFANDAADVADRPFFRRAVQWGEFVAGDYEFDPTERESTITLAYPLPDKRGRTDAVLFTVMNLTWVQELFSEAMVPEGTLVTVLDETGTIVANESNPGQWVGQAALRGSAFQALLARGTGGTIEGTSLDGVRRMVAFHPLGRPAEAGGLYVSIGVPLPSITAAADRILARNLALFGLAGVLAMAVAWGGIDLFLLRRVNQMVTATNRLSGGDLTARIGMRRGPAELQQLARAFDGMAGALEERQEEVRARTEALAAQEKRFRALVENSSDGVVLLDAEATLRYASPSTTRILGYAVDELVGCDAMAHVHPDDRDRVRAVFAGVVREPGVIGSDHFRVRRKDGAWRWIGSVYMNLLAEPSVQAIVSNYRDITSRREAEEKLREAHNSLECRVKERTAELQAANEALLLEIAERNRAEQTLHKLSRAIEQTGDSVLVANREGVIEYVNPAFERLTGYSRDEAVGATPRLVSSGKHDKVFYEDLWSTLLSGREFRSVFINQTKDGRLYYEDRTISPISDGTADVTHFVCTGRDISERMRVEEAMRRMNDRLEHEAARIAGVLHDEAGQLLTSAHIALADVAIDVPPPARERLHGIRSYLNEVEDHLRRLSHELRPRILDDLGLVEALKFLGESVSRRTRIPISVEASLDRRCPLVMETAVYRLVQEALTNMTKHAGASHAIITLEQDARGLSCSVRDDGLGFDVSAVFDRPGKSQLGLVGIRDRVEAAGGTLDIITTPGTGTELRARLPLPLEI